MPDSSGSFIGGVLNKARNLVNEPDTISATDDNYILREYIVPAYQRILALIEMHSSRRIVAEQSLSLTNSDDYFILPPWVGTVERLVQYDTNRRIKNDWVPRGRFHPSGPGWSLEGNMLHIRPRLSEAQTWVIVASHNGDVQMHRDTEGQQLTDSTFKLGATPTVGMLDTRPNAYVGCVLRILESGNVQQERIITAYDASTRIATLAADFDTDSFLSVSAATIEYEVTPPASSIWEAAIAAEAALDIAAIANVTEKKMAFIEISRDRNLKAILDREQAFQSRVSKHIEADTIDNEFNRQYWYLTSY